MGLFQRWFTGSNDRRNTRGRISPTQPEAPTAPPLTDTDYEFLFTQLLEGITHGWQPARVLRFFEALGERGNPAQWIAWLERFSERLIASPAPNREIAFRMLQLSEQTRSIPSLQELGEVADEISRQLLTRGQERPIWEWSGPDASTTADAAEGSAGYPSGQEVSLVYQENEAGLQQEEPQEVQQLTLDELFVLLQQDPNLVEQLAQQLQLDTDDPQVLVQALVNQFNNAENAATQAPPEEAEDWFNQGNERYRAGDFAGAIASWDKVLEMEPDDYQAWNNRGSALGNLGRLEDAVASYDKALENQPDLHEAWCNRGLALKDLGRLEEAVASYDKALQLKLDFHEAWNNRGNALSQLGRYEQAIASYDGTLEIRVADWQSWINRGMAAGKSASCDPELTSFSAVAQNNPELNQRGYQGQLASFQEGLKYIRPDLHPEGWGSLHQAIGNTYNDQASLNSDPALYWRKAVAEYKEALQTLTVEEFPELHLEVLLNLMQTLVSLRDTAEAEEVGHRGSELLRRLLAIPNCPDELKKQLSLKFVGFHQLSVDIAVQAGRWVEALEMAEKGKNACLTWLLYGWRDEILSPSWREMQQLLNPATAAIYWHKSPATLTTFILKHDAPEPIVFLTPTETDEEEPYTSVQQLQEVSAWIKDWNQQYTAYRYPQDKRGQVIPNWRDHLPQMITQLRNLLHLSEVLVEIAGVTQLILIPHRDLHRLPLHALFPDDFIISYLPSIQMGLSVVDSASGLPLTQEDGQDVHSPHQLFSVEHPNTEGLPSLAAAEIEAAGITQLFNSPSRLAGEQATKEQVTHLLSTGYKIFYFNGYAIDNFTTPSQSALALRGQDQLTIEEICRLPLNGYQLATFSAYEAVMTDNPTFTAEYVGLVSAFLSQGVAQVLSPLWTVESISGVLLMIRFYQLLKAGVAAAPALKQTQLWLCTLTYAELAHWYQDLSTQLTSYNRGISEQLKFEAALIQQDLDKMNSPQFPYAHPYHWAAFTITGKFALPS